MRRPADIVRSESSESIQEYRAALMSVFLNTLPQNDPSRLLVPSLQPLMLSQAVNWIHRLPDRLQRKAKAHAAYRLAVATFVEKRESEFAPMLLQLLGPEEERALRAKLSFLGPTTPDLVFKTIYEPLEQPTDPASSSQDFKASSHTAERRELEPRRHRLRRTEPLPVVSPITAPAAQHAQSTLDLDTLTTTVWIQAPSHRDFDDLRRILDPRSWSQSPFWPESYQVELSEDGKEFTKVQNKQPPGETWHGQLFEHVEWNWNTFSVSSFRNFLNISFEVSENPQRIRLDFSLYSCEGSTLFVREARNGVDVDRGYVHVERVNTPPGFFAIDTQKNIRFSDILDRRTPLEGPVGSGQILSFMAPAIVGLWMHDLLSNLYFPE